MFRVIIAGGRDYGSYSLLCKTMDRMLCNKQSESIQIVCGKAHGADTLGERYARERGYSVNDFPANWKTYGKRAGYIRNVEMAQNADALVAFWDGQSRGTAHMIKMAKEYGLLVRVINYKR